MSREGDVRALSLVRGSGGSAGRCEVTSGLKGACIWTVKDGDGQVLASFSADETALTLDELQAIAALAARLATRPRKAG